MKSTQKPNGEKRNRKGIALVTVISVLAIMTVLTVAMLSLSQNERKSSVRYADGEAARNLADTAINVVMAQIWEGSRQESAGSSTRMIWASQPGAIRKYNTDGSFYRGYKLYSDDVMVMAGQEREMSLDTPAADWQQKPAMWTNLNEPVVRPDSTTDQDPDPEVIHPIVDPRAFIRGDMGANGNNKDESPNIEGFTYQTTMAGVVDATSVTDVDARLPMPVRWLYVLKDGTIGHLVDGAAGTFTFVGPNGAVATTENPMVGRIAFWTDDETSRININTAGEPTAWIPPMFHHSRDLDFAMFQPTRFEYQRYPGHPATVAMSTVLFPNRDLDPYGKSDAKRDEILGIKERLYDIMPKINRGGSKAGTAPFWYVVDDAKGTVSEYRVDVSQSLKQPLYATVDELLFSQRVNSGERLTHDASPGATVPLFDQFTNEDRALERVRFFLTAQSRAPEINIFGTPRVAIWPVANESNIGPMSGDAKAYRTVFDNLVAYCGTLGEPGSNSNSYFFRRGDSTSASNDVDRITRNRRLLDYLHTLMGRNYPTGGRGPASFTGKYGPDAAQILAEIFDYIRCTNLCDPVQLPAREDLRKDPYRLAAPGMTTLLTKTAMLRRDQLRTQVKTFTPPPASYNRGVDPAAGMGGSRDNEMIVAGGFPGHGQVVPIETNIGGQNVRGFGRFPTISEVGLHFICTADGANDEDSWRIRVPDPMNDGKLKIPTMDEARASNTLSGGRSSPQLTNTPVGNVGGEATIDTEIDPVIKKIDGRDVTINKVWYSNFPSYPPLGAYGTDPTVNANHPKHYSFHPGFNPANWNATLSRSLALSEGQRRVQASLCFEITVPSSGNTGIFPDMSMEIEGLNAFRISSGGGRPQSIFNTIGSARRSWRAGAGPNSPPNGGLFEYSFSNNRRMGGSAGPFAFSQGRRVIGWEDMPDDPGYDANLTSGGNTYDGAPNFDFCSSFFTVKSTDDPLSPSPTYLDMTFQGGPLKVNLYAGRNMNAQNLVQTFDFTFPSAQVPVPELVVLSTPREEWQDQSGNKSIQVRADCPRWWSFNWGGALRRWTGNWDGVNSNLVLRSTPNPDTAGQQDENRRTLGRFYLHGSNHGGRGGRLPHMHTIFYLSTSNTYSKARQSRTTKTNKGYQTPDKEGPFGQDVAISLVPKHGDIRLIALQKAVPASEFVQHPNYGNTAEFSAHSFMNFMALETAGKNGAHTGSNVNLRLVPLAKYHPNRAPDLPQTGELASGVAARYGDFDNGQGVLRDGPWINRPDEGDTGMGMRASTFGSGGIIRFVSAYYHDDFGITDDAGEAYASPNRLLASPGVFGSLSVGAKGRDPWRTLLFRPFVPQPGASVNSHPGSPDYGLSGGQETTRSPFAGKNPADHLLLDLFWMPVVEPYAISEPLSTAGKINMNYQLVPFNSYIRRATGIHAVMKGEMLQAVDTASAHQYHRLPSNRTISEIEDGKYGSYWQYPDWTDVKQVKYTDSENPFTAQRYWHRKIDLETKSSRAAESTMAQFDDRFDFRHPTLPAGAQGLFRTASQICEIFLVPKKVGGTAPAITMTTSTVPKSDGSDSAPNTPYSYKSMAGFWQPRAITGDNTRERPYANLYAKVTTQSNTFRVYYRAQTIRKARSVDPNTFDPSVDSVTSDYRGSALIERRIDPNDTRIPDYANNPNAEALENFYNFRVLENKRFIP